MKANTAVKVVPLRGRPRTAEEPPRILCVKDVMEIMNLSKSTAYRLMRELNAELRQQGFKVFAGRIPRSYLMKRCFGEWAE